MRWGQSCERHVASGVAWLWVPRAGATPAARITFVDKYAGAGTEAGAACRIWPLSLAIVVICQISERPPALRGPPPMAGRVSIVVRLVVVVVDDADIRYEKYEATAQPITIVAPATRLGQREATVEPRSSNLHSRQGTLYCVTSALSPFSRSLSLSAGLSRYLVWAHKAGAHACAPPQVLRGHNTRARNWQPPHTSSSSVLSAYELCCINHA